MLVFSCFGGSPRLRFFCCGERGGGRGGNHKKGGRDTIKRGRKREKMIWCWSMRSWMRDTNCRVGKRILVKGGGGVSRF